MELFLLSLNGLVTPQADENDRLVVAAPRASVARRIAADNAADEGRQSWLDPNRSSCEKIGTAKIGQKEKIILCRSRCR